ncbi:DUF3413 domain-containing protein [Vibrio fluvialis]|nr:DUF3413 domain-containing protein [Vibrio fluvialis]
MLLTIRQNVRWLFSHFILNAVLFSMLGLPYLTWMTPPDNDVIAQLYLFTTQAGWFGLFAGLIATIMLPLCWLPLRVVRPLAILVTWLSSVLLLIDVAVYQQYRFHLSGFIWELLLQGGDEVISLSWYTIAIAALQVLGVAVACLVIALMSNYLAKRSLRWMVGASVIWLASLLVSQSIHMWRDAHYDTTVPSYSVHWPLYYPLTGKRLLDKLGLVDTQTVREQSLTLPRPSHSHLNYPLHPLDIRQPDQTPNILFIAIDTWRYDDANQDVTPNIAQFAQRSLRFEQHLSGGNSTQAGIFSLFYGLPATYWDSFHANQKRPVMMKALEALDYQFAIYASAPLNSPPFDRTVFRGINNLRVDTPAETSPLRDQRITDDFVDFLKTRNTNQPYFGFLFYDSAHATEFPADMEPRFTPSWNRVDHIKLDNDFNPEPYRNRYRNALYYIDGQIERVLNAVEAQGGLENTIIVITSDHGQEFNDNHKNYWGHGSNYSMAQIHVPLYIYVPGERPEKIDWKTTHLDIAPTFMHRVLGVQNSTDDYSVGYDLLDTERDREWLIIGSYFNYALVADDEIMVTYPSGAVQTMTPQLEPKRQRSLSSGDLMQALKQMNRFLN